MPKLLFINFTFFLILQVEPNTLFLKEKFGDQSYWPNETGKFNFSQLYDGCSLMVMGTSASTSTGNHTQTAATTTLAITQPGPSSLFSAKGSWGKKTLFSCKIIFANMEKNGKGQPQFTEKSKRSLH